MIDLDLDCAEEEEAAVLLLRSLYATADPAAPLRGASQAELLQVRSSGERTAAGCLTRCRHHPTKGL